MNEVVRYRGKVFSPKEIDEIRELMATHCDRSRWFISRELCRRGVGLNPTAFSKI
jgi:hypothetical protein